MFFVGNFTQNERSSKVSVKSLIESTQACRQEALREPFNPFAERGVVFLPLCRPVLSAAENPQEVPDGL